jgi:hypothetical protein
VTYTFVYAVIEIQIREEYYVERSAQDINSKQSEIILMENRISRARRIPTYKQKIYPQQ